MLESLLQARTHFRVFSLMVLTVLAYFHFEAKNSICNKFRIALDDSKVTFRPHLKKAIVQSVQQVLLC